MDQFDQAESMPSGQVSIPLDLAAPTSTLRRGDRESCLLVVQSRIVALWNELHPGVVDWNGVAVRS